jgi:hypothetical protein
MKILWRILVSGVEIAAVLIAIPAGGLFVYRVWEADTTDTVTLAWAVWAANVLGMIYVLLVAVVISAINRWLCSKDER